MVLLAVDIGGTFTDLMGYDEAQKRFFQAKSLTTPHEFSQGIIDCVKKSGVTVGSVAELIHGTTVAINTLIERTGAKTALVVTRGMRDIYIIGRGNRPESYNLLFHRAKPLVPRHRTHEVNERVLASGDVYEKLDPKEIEELAKVIKEQDVESIAVCFIHSYANPKHEAEVGRILKEKLPGVYVSLSHEVLREFREYERLSTTAVNSYVGPRVSGYITNLEGQLKTIGFNGDLAIMQSNGGVMSPDAAKKRPATMMESGPVGGIIASAEVGKALGYQNVIAFDMGGTTAKASLVQDGEPTHAEGYYVGGYASGDPVILPVVAVVEVGAGGGSIAWLDEVNALKVGPKSASAAPGPICYGRGGTEPTITDANVVLGRVGAEDFLGGEMPLDAKGALAGIKSKLSDRLKLTPINVADAILKIAINKMSLAVREVSVEKGYDPRDFAMVASGGAGPLHAVAIARELHIPTVIIPRFPAHFSALGMLMANERHDFTRTKLTALAKLDPKDLRAIIDEMIAESRKMLREAKDVEFIPYLDLRYVGQEFSISVPMTHDELKKGDVTSVRQRFDAIHEQRYAHNASDEPVEMVNVRLAAVGKRPTLHLPPLDVTAKGAPAKHRPVYYGTETPVDCPVYFRDNLPAGFEFAGPALVQEYASTTVMFAGDHCKVAPTGELIVSVGVEK